MHPDICHGNPVVRGLRFPVENILEWLASGMTPAQILNEYPDLENEDIAAVLADAARPSSITYIDTFAA